MTVSELERIVDYAKSLDCIHCGLCLTTCPTYRLTGAEASSPRGRIHLMRAVAEKRLQVDGDFAEEMDFCLVCRHCESVCPAGVQFGAMMELTRDGLTSRARNGFLGRVLKARGLATLKGRKGLRFTHSLLRLAQATGAMRLVSLFGARAKALAATPRVPGRADRAPLPAVTPARGETVASAAVLEGCVMPELFGRVNRATVASLAAGGVESHAPEGHACCGALHAHNGDLTGARSLARETIVAFDALTDADGQPLEIVVNSAGCGAHMKEYERLLEDDADWAERARTFSKRVFDFAEYLTRPAASERLSRTARPVVELGRIAWDDPCHLCHGQGVRAEPRALLDLVPDLARVEMQDPEACCGSAGIYSILRPADSQAVLEPKLAALRTSGAQTLVTSNPGCQMQWESGLRRAGSDVRVMHLAEVLALSCREPDSPHAEA